MAIRALAGETHLVLRNSGREGANPPVVFQTPINDQSSFSYGIWVKAFTNIPSNVTVISGTDGSQLQIFYDGNNWRLRVRSLGIEFGQLYIAPAILNTWTLIIFIVNGSFIDIWTGTEASPPGPDTYITLTNPIHQAYPINFNLDYIAVSPQSGISMCNFKYWNTILTLGGYLNHMHNWYPNVDSEPAPIWASTLRTPGDISNIANPYTSSNWAAGHGFSSISDINNLVFDSLDPAYIARHSACPTWVYLKDPNALCNVNPGQTPLTPTIYKAPQFHQFDDRGSVPITNPVIDIVYYAWPHKSDPRPGQVATFPLWKDEHGIEVSDTTHGFEFNTGVPVPAAMNYSNFYDWVYGAQFQYAPATPQQPTADAGIRYMYLYVRYIGFPTGVGIAHVPGVPPLPPVDPPVPPGDPPIPPPPGEPPIPPPPPTPVAMSGLFAINKGGPSVDKYDATIELKIPDPTIRTAYIGE